VSGFAEDVQCVLRPWQPQSWIRLCSGSGWPSTLQDGPGPGLSSQNCPPYSPEVLALLFGHGSYPHLEMLDLTQSGCWAQQPSLPNLGPKAADTPEHGCPETLCTCIIWVVVTLGQALVVQVPWWEEQSWGIPENTSLLLLWEAVLRPVLARALIVKRVATLQGPDHWGTPGPLIPCTCPLLGHPSPAMTESLYI
jgi:hypothetical protein